MVIFLPYFYKCLRNVSLSSQPLQGGCWKKLPRLFRHLSEVFKKYTARSHRKTDTYPSTKVIHKDTSIKLEAKQKNVLYPERYRYLASQK